MIDNTHLIAILRSGSPLSQDQRNAIADNLQAMGDNLSRHVEMVENVQMVMAETQPSWGYRLFNLLSQLGLNFGDGDTLDRAITNDVMHKLAMDHEDMSLGDRFDEVRRNLELHLARSVRSGGKVEPGPLRTAMKAAGVHLEVEAETSIAPLYPNLWLD